MPKKVISWRDAAVAMEKKKRAEEEKPRRKTSVNYTEERIAQLVSGLDAVASKPSAIKVRKLKAAEKKRFVVLSAERIRLIALRARFANGEFEDLEPGLVRQMLVDQARYIAQVENAMRAYGWQA